MSKKQDTPAFNIDELIFPKDFVWGSATAAHQVEGNQNNQLTQFEKDNANRFASEAEAKLKNIVPNWDLIKPMATDPNNYISGKAVDQYNLYNSDIQLMKQMKLNSYRFSIEWSRIEPVPGQFDKKEIDHYKKLIAALRANGIEPFVTLWHRSEPVWILEQGDWENSKTIESYTAFVEYVAQQLGPDVKYWVTFNEPILHVVAGFMEGSIPPEVKSFRRGLKVLDNMIEAHKQAYDVLHKYDSDAIVGSTQAMQIGSASPNTLANQLLSSYLNHVTNEKFFDETKDQSDFLGIQYYGTTLFALDFGKHIVKLKAYENTEAAVRSDAGREVYPYGIYELLKQTFERYHKPIIITENGIADIQDTLRADYIKNHLYWVKKAIDEGIPVKGYIHWSLIDNFEWTSGYWPQFGLISVDRTTLKRTIRPSALIYKQIIEQSQK
ncbi:MAG: glycoside hydrolase family 1 protein [Candidatus Doudnabacteria bacterium]|nr:glycoside hydrolase family 1 protein [Candidatus Doudnabacteria bacterium]